MAQLMELEILYANAVKEPTQENISEYEKALKEARQAYSETQVQEAILSCERVVGKLGQPINPP